MSSPFVAISATDATRRAQVHYYGAAAPRPERAQGNAPSPELGPEEVEFIQACDSFYLATINEHGWPYVQHRGGRTGFLKVTGPATLAFADYKGNRQLLSTGNLATNDRVSLFIMDYPRRTRLKLLGHAHVLDAREHPALVASVAEVADRPLIERVFSLEVVAFDWNCPKHITPRFTTAQVEAAVQPLKQRIAELEAQLHDRR